jgi:hypothetical protein
MTAQRTIPLHTGSGELKASQGTTAPAPASVLAIAEMNLEEYPAFRLGRRSKRLELRYSRTRTDAEGHTLEQTWVVRGVEGLGLPGPFEQDLYVALLVLFTEQGLPADGRIRFTRNRLAQVMGCSNSGRGYELLEQGLSRLAGATVHTEHAFYRPGAISPKGERSGLAERLSLDFHILEEVRVYERRTFVDAADAVDADTTIPAGDETGARPLVERGRPLEVSVARLGQPLVQSYERRYTKGLDATFYFGLERPLAKRLYRYLDKVRNGRGGFEIGLLALADVLGLEYRYPSDVKDGLSDAHAELQATGYLAGAGYAPLAGGPKAGEKVVYGIQPAFDKRPRRRAGAAEPPPAALGEVIPRRNGAESREQRALPDVVFEASLERAPALPAPPPESAPPARAPRQIELESLGVSPARAAALVAAHPDATIAAHIAYVRRRQQGRSGEVPLKNAAGFLARAIEEGYSLPPAAPLSVPPPAPSAPLPPAPASGPAQGPAQRPAQASSHGPETGPETAALDEAAAGSATAEPVDDSPWGRLMAGLRERVSPATFAAWVRPAVPASGAAGAEPGPPASLTVVLPSAFALDRWRRPPIATALQQASVAAGITVVLELQPAAVQEA